jgi:hypothetical protein
MSDPFPHNPFRDSPTVRQRTAQLAERTTTELLAYVAALLEQFLPEMQMDVAAISTEVATGIHARIDADTPLDVRVTNTVEVDGCVEVETVMPIDVRVED